MYVRFICGCKLENHTLSDWTCHWKYGKRRNDDNWIDKYPKLRAIKLFLLTRIELVKE